MKKIFYLSLSFVLIISLQFTPAQNQNNTSAGPIPNVKHQKNNPQQNHSQSDFLGTAYGYSNIQNYILSIQLPEGTLLTQLTSWNPIDFASSMSIAEWPYEYYITVVSQPPSLYKLDVLTGDITLVGYITGMGSDLPNGISYNRLYDDFYLISGTNLYSFDPSTLTASLIGPFNSGGNMIDLCFDWTGVCYAYDILTDNAYTINLSSGLATLLGPLGYDANYGQGMSYDFETSTIYISAFNNSTFTGQLRTMNPATGMTTLVTDWGHEQIAPFTAPYIPCMSPIPIPTNPVPENGATDIPITGVTLNWINGDYTTNVEVWFGKQENLFKVYDGPAITSWTLDTLLYNTIYQWRILCKDTTCYRTWGNIWSFTTKQDPNFIELFIDDFSDGTGNWTIINDGGTCVWDISTLARPYTIPPTASGNVFAADADLCGQGTTLLSTATIIQVLDFGIVLNSTIEFDNDWKVIGPSDEAHLEVSTNGGSSWFGIWNYVGVSLRNTHEIVDASFLDGKQDVIIRLRSVQPGWDWWWAIDNFQIYGSSIPVGFSQGMEENRQSPSEFSLEQNYPNPFNPTTKIKYTIPNADNPLPGGARGGLVTLNVYDVLGKEVATLVNEEKPSGVYEVEFNAANLPSGIYFYQLKAVDPKSSSGKGFIETRKMILLK